MKGSRTAAELGLTLVERRPLALRVVIVTSVVVVVATILGIVAAIPIESFFRYRNQVHDANARLNVRALAPAIDGYFSDNGSYAGMTLPVLKRHYDRSIDPAGYALTGVTATSYCLSTSSGGRKWRKPGPGASMERGDCR